MTTVAETIINQTIKKQQELELIRDNLEDLVSDLIGMEITYKGEYAVIDHVFDDFLHVRLYVEEKSGYSFYTSLALIELLQYVRG
jgi:hypothetical protein